jgi:hypothetical protein
MLPLYIHNVLVQWAVLLLVVVQLLEVTGFTHNQQLPHRVLTQEESLREAPDGGLNSSSSTDGYCDDGITSRVQSLMVVGTIPMLVPYGRAFVGSHFGQALYYAGDLDHNTFLVRSCYLPTTQKQSYHTKHLCFNVTLAGLLVGSEIVAPTTITPRYVRGAAGEHPPICEWTIKFTERVRSGTYELQLWTYKMNEFADLEQELIDPDKKERHNTGEIISLSGLGNMHGMDVFPFVKYNFDGHIVRHNNGKALFVVINATTIRGFRDFDAFVAGGYNVKSTITMPEEFFLSRVIEYPELNETTVKLAPPPTSLWGFEHHRRNLIPHRYNETSHRESFIFSLPTDITVRNEHQTGNATTVAPRPLRLCRDPADSLEMSQGRWEFRKTCEERYPWQSKQQTEFFRDILPGDICRHAERVVTEGVPNQMRGYVFKPWDCDILQLDTREILVNTEYAEKALSSSIFCDVVKSIETSNSRDMLQFTKASAKLFAPITPSSAVAESVVSLHTPLSLCLRTAGIGMLIGCGDSLGVEQLDDMRNMFGNQQHWSEEGHSITCTGEGHTNLHSVSDGPRLVKCIEDAVDSMMASNASRKMSLFVHNSTASTVIVRPGHGPYSGIHDVYIPVNSILLVTNFMVQHATGKLPLQDIENGLHEQAKLHTLLAHRLKEKYGLEYRRIFMSGIAIHAFKIPYLTNARQRWANNRAKEILVAEGGFDVFDAFNITYARPDGTSDGTHYEGGVARAITDVLVHKICMARCP